MIKSHQLNMLDIAYLHQKQTLHQSRSGDGGGYAIHRSRDRTGLPIVGT
jgi:hypothetical protein